MYNRNTRYRFFTPNGTLPIALEDDKKDDKKIKAPQQTHTDQPDATDDDLQNVDKSKGGYGGGSGFGPDRT